MHRRADGRLLWLRALLRALLPRLLPPEGEVPVEDPTRWRRSPLRLILESELVDPFDDLEGEKTLAWNGHTCGAARGQDGCSETHGCDDRRLVQRDAFEQRRQPARRHLAV